MNQEQFNALMEYIDCRVDEKIQDAFGREANYEHQAQYEAFEALKKAFNVE